MATNELRLCILPALAVNEIRMGRCLGSQQTQHNIVLSDSLTLDDNYTVSFTANYDANTERPVAGVTRAAYTPSQSVSHSNTCLVQPGVTTSLAQRPMYTHGQPVQAKLTALSLSKLKKVQKSIRASFTLSDPIYKHLKLTSISSIQTPSNKNVFWGITKSVSKSQVISNHLLIKVRLAKQFTYVSGGSVAQYFDLLNSQPIFVTRSRHLVYTHGKPLTPGHHRLVPPLQPKTPIILTTGNNDIRMCALLNLAVNEIRMGLRPCYTIPIRKTYIVDNSITLIRVDNSTPLLALAFSLSVNWNSWSYTWSAKVLGSQLNDVLAVDAFTPIEVLATINGTSFKLVIEKVSRSRSFESNTVDISGRGISAYLGSPYAPITTLYSADAITAQQACDQALTYNAVPIGWTVNWQLDDWLIAGHALSNTGVYIDHLNRIAEAGGGYVQPHPTDNTINILPYYPVAPWLLDQEIPDISLTESPVQTESISWETKPDYNGVWINGGASGGRLDHIIKAGTAGDYDAPTIVDNLATDAIMTRQRGIKTLGDTGRILNISLSLQVLPETGIIMPGTILQYVVGTTTRFGITRSLSLNYSTPNLWQNLEVESHEYI